jgi:hypothetical protein
MHQEIPILIRSTSARCGMLVNPARELPRSKENRPHIEGRLRQDKSLIIIIDLPPKCISPQHHARTKPQPK